MWASKLYRYLKYEDYILLYSPGMISKLIIFLSQLPECWVVTPLPGVNEVLQGNAHTNGKGLEVEILTHEVQACNVSNTTVISFSRL